MKFRLSHNNEGKYAFTLDTLSCIDLLFLKNNGQVNLNKFSICNKKPGKKIIKSNNEHIYGVIKNMEQTWMTSILFKSILNRNITFDFSMRTTSLYLVEISSSNLQKYTHICKCFCGSACRMNITYITKYWNLSTFDITGEEKFFAYLIIFNLATDSNVPG